MPSLPPLALRHLLCIAIASSGPLACGGDGRESEPVADTAAGSKEALPEGVDGAWLFTDAGAGPLRIGMSAAAARSALGVTQPDAAPRDPACAYARVGPEPESLRLMWVEGTLVRLEAIDRTLATDRGARVGDSEARLDSLYAGRGSTRPHKYDPRGRYRIVPATGDSTRRLVFETNGAVVTQFRVGRMPEVEWVEGCS